MEMSKILVFIAVLAAATSAANAKGLDGSEPLICSSIVTYDCSPDSSCIKGTAASIDAPQFIWLDFEQKLARSERASGEKRTAKINSVSQGEGELILQGVQRGLGWSMVISQENGAMALTAAGKQVVFVVFGACTPS